MARDLLWRAVTKVNPDWIISWIINETEAYREDDEASHSFWWKKTLRNEVMFKEAWHLYVYFTYWMYYCLNIVTEDKWYWSAVLIRSVIPYKWQDLMLENRKKYSGNNLLKIDNKNLTNWPAKVCMAFDISNKDNWINLLDNDSIIYLEDIWYNVLDIKTSKRIGISRGIDKELRFYF